MVNKELKQIMLNIQFQDMEIQKQRSQLNRVNIILLLNQIVMDLIAFDTRNNSKLCKNRIIKYIEI